MKDAAPFESTPEFQHFADVMKRVIAVPKAEMDQEVRESSVVRKGKAKERKAQSGGSGKKG